jgi:nucleoside-diphosphate kinase
MLKPGAVARGLVGKILARIENRGLNIVALKILRLTQAQAEKLYEIHEGKSFFRQLVQHVSSGPVVVMVVEGPGAIKVLRKIAGSTNPLEAEVGTIRGDFGLTITKNVIHAADGPENAVREISLFFKQKEILSIKN